MELFDTKTSILVWFFPDLWFLVEQVKIGDKWYIPPVLCTPEAILLQEFITASDLKLIGRIH